MIVNKAAKTGIPEYIFEIIRDNEITEKELQDILGEDFKKELRDDYGYRWNRLAGDSEINYTEILNYICVEANLQHWQYMFDYSGCPIVYRYNDRKTGKIIYEDTTMELDGYSQSNYQFTSAEDRQCFSDGIYLDVFIANVAGGICCRINLRNSECTFYAIGEDDGHWFITTCLWTTVSDNIPYWKNLLMSEISELRFTGLNNQKVIENIWNSNLEVQKKYRW